MPLGRNMGGTPMPRRDILRRVTTGVSFKLGQRGGRGGRLAATLFGGLFLAAGLGMTFLAGRALVRDLATRGWDRVPCVITASSVEIVDDGYAFAATYRYDAGGRGRRGATVRRGYHGSADYADAAALLARYPEGADATCRVDPADSSAAVLEAGGWAKVGVVPFCLTFAAIGGGVLYAAWRRTDATPDGSVADGAELSGRGGAVFLIVCAVFFTIGTVALGWGFLPALLKVHDARDWPAVPATVVNSRLQVSSDSDSTTYRVDILYQYAFAGRTWRSAQYQFAGLFSNVGVGEKRALVEGHAPGSRIAAYVNPADPADAVLQRGLTWDYAFALIPLVFMLFGAGGGAATLLTWRDANAPPLAASQRKETLAKPQAAADGEEPRVRRSQPKGCAFAFLTVFSLVWNGLMWSKFLSDLGDGGSGGLQWIGFLFIAPFLLIGLGLIGLTGYVGLTLLNPTVEATIDPPQVAPGGTFTVSWTLQGRYDRVRRLTLLLEGTEETESGSGDNKSTASEIFYKQDCFATTRADQIERGTAAVTVPPDAVSSFGGKHNRIVWKLKLRGEIPRWPDVTEAYQLRVAPDDSPPTPAPPPAKAGVAGGSADATDLQIVTLDGRTAYRPGDVLAGTASWSLARPPAAAEVRLFWYTAGKGTRDVGVVDTLPLEHPAATDARPFAFDLPAGPWSVAGTLVAVRWAVELALSPGKASSRYEFTLSPTGGAVALHES